LGRRRARGFFSCSRGCARGGETVEVDDRAEEGAIGGGADSRDSARAGGSAESAVRKPDVRKSRWACAAERLVRMSACSSECCYAVKTSDHEQKMYAQVQPCRGASCTSRTQTDTRLGDKPAGLLLIGNAHLDN